MLPGKFERAVLLQPGQAAVSSKGQTDSCLLSWYLNAPEEEVQTVWRFAFDIRRLAFGEGWSVLGRCHGNCQAAESTAT